MATINDSSIKFFSKAKSDQWLFVLAQYKKVFEVRAQATRGSKKSGPQEAIKLDNWYQEELPKLLQSRKHVIHEELVQITKWKLWRTKNRAGLLDLVRMNTELAVKQVSTKAFKKCPTNLQGAISALVNLKGIGVATASAILCACFPEICPFMADECLDSVPGIENTNYTVNEFIAFADQIKACCERLQAEDPTAKWTPHKVELTLWTHYWIKEMKLNLLDKMPTSEGVEDETEETGSDDVVKSSSKSNGDSHVKLSSCSSTNGSGSGNGDRVLDEDSNISVPVSNASEVEESKSNEEEEEEDEDDDSRSADVVRNNNGTNRMSKNNRNIMNNNSNTSNSNSAYNCIEDSKDGMRVDENSRQQLISNGDNSNLSYSNLSSDDLNNSTTENTADNTSDAPTNLTTSNNMNNIMNTTSSSNVSTTCSLSPLPPPPPPPVAAIAVPLSSVVSEAEAEADGEAEAAASVSVMELAPQSGPVTVTNNGHFASNGESCKNIDNNDSEIISDTVGSSVVDDLVSSNSIKRPLEEITSSVDGLQDNGSLDKKSRIE